MSNSDDLPEALAAWLFVALVCVLLIFGWEVFWICVLGGLGLGLGWLVWPH